jgi:hypothetical protein
MIGFGENSIPARIQLLNHIGNQHDVIIVTAWSDPTAVISPTSESLDVDFGYVPHYGWHWTPQDRHLPVPAPGGWTFENGSYSLRLSRSGLITELRSKEGPPNELPWPAKRDGVAGSELSEGGTKVSTPGSVPGPLASGPSPGTARGESRQPIVSNADLYTDRGFGSGKTRYSASNEAEAASRMWKDEEGHLRFRFEGRLRGFYRFDLLKPPLEYFFDYTLDEHSPSFRMSWGIRPHAPPTGKSAFLGLLMPLPEIRQASYYRGGKLVSGGTGVSPVLVGNTGKIPVPPSSSRVGQGRADSWWGSRTATSVGHPLSPEQRETSDRSPTIADVRSTHPTNQGTGKMPVPPNQTPVPAGRGWQFQSLGPGVVPDRIELAGDNAPLLRISDLRCGGVPLSNGFLNGKQFFLTFYDGKPSSEGQGQWRWASAVVTPGAAEPAAIGAPPPPPAKAQEVALLEDPGFEAAAESTPVSLRTGQPLPGYTVESAWLAPPGGRLVAAPVHSGQAAAEVVNTSGQYALWRQPLLAARFARGSRWRLSAWVKGEAIQPGDASWKSGTVRFSVAGGPTKYVAAPPLLGTFPWRQVSVELTIPAALEGLGVEIGLNGATGKMWIDDVELKPLR